MAFNGDLYATAATVIPVLFIALMFPNGLLARYALWCKQWRSKRGVPAVEEGRAQKIRSVNNRYLLLIFPVDLVLLAGSWGEVCAFIALIRRHATQVERLVVIASVVVLPVIAALSAMTAISQSWAAGLTKRTSETPARADAAHPPAPQGPPPAPPGLSSPPTPGPADGASSRPPGSAAPGASDGPDAAGLDHEAPADPAAP